MKKDKIFIGVFLFIIFGVLAFLPVKHVLIVTGKSSLQMTDNWVYFEAKPENNIVDKLDNKFNQIKTAVENRVTNYFPFYIELNTMYQNFNFKTNKLLFDKYVPLKTNSDEEYVFYNKEDNFYYLENKYTKEELDNRLETQVKFFNSLSNKGIDVNIYIPTRYEITTLKDNNLNSYISLLLNKLNSNINITAMNVTDIETYKKYFYKTDHHWTIYGALDGYKDIMNMLGADAIDVDNIVTLKERKYYGSLAKSIMNDELSDYITDMKIDLDYDVLVNGEKPDELFKPRKLKMDRSYKYYDYYVQYFNGQYGNVIYDYHNEEKDNLLIMSDSNAWQIDYLIAASYNKTHVINLRYDEYKNDSFDLRRYMEVNDISKVLFLYDGETILFDQFNYDFIGRVK